MQELYHQELTEVLQGFTHIGVSREISKLVEGDHNERLRTGLNRFEIRTSRLGCLRNGDGVRSCRETFGWTHALRRRRQVWIGVRERNVRVWELRRDRGGGCGDAEKARV